MSKITALHAQEILDSRGNPTIRVHLGLDGGVKSRRPFRPGPQPVSTRRSS